MCGVAGIIKLKGEIQDTEINQLREGLKFQKHRGPDALGVWSDQKVALGHNRLSIIDLSTQANQPFSREDLQLKIIFNGEIYNYKELKKTLQEKQYTFQTSSDTEVILAAYKEYGEKVCNHLVGMFVFVIYDLQNQSIFVARDRFGEKPFFYLENSGTIYFASELKALQKTYNQKLTINQNAVFDLMENMYINGLHTIYEEVHLLPPGNFLKIKDGEVTISSYYSFPTKVKRKNSFEELKSEVKGLLYDIVEHELHADVPVATFLSSGIDSSLITAIAKELKPDILAVTMATAESHSDESPAATEFAKKLDIKQEIIPVDPGSLSVLGDLLSHVQPLADASLIPSYLVTKAVSGHTKVMLSGDGGDEVFGSYNKPNIYKEFGGSVGFWGKLAVKTALNSDSNNIDKYLSDKNRIKYAGWEGFYRKHNLSYKLGSQIFNSYRPQLQVLKEYKKIQRLYESNPEKSSFGVDINTRLPSDFLHKVDTAAMLSSVEVRAPFLDHRLVDLSLETDMSSLSPNGIDKEVTKSLLKEFTGDLPSKSKKGFSIPYLTFLQGAWGEILEGYLKDGKSIAYLGFNQKGILDLLNEFRNSPTQRIARVLFSVLVLEIWLRVFHLEQEVNLEPTH
ncbi:asparagine synthase (glutamine-hydrolyzing) [Algoriphagus machipongonensis]|uniref:asparagine synthase (glutamine-hydrolyzing) n=1 Tax=Algoriphagus machipongonensis TaxID=388413 RepID=A3I1Z0_9BACT|nr:asparagine synthase (glutamine-hydrolyzing) [Algoriphagus machipongonensis]EAZ79806.1 asparagine synthase (glutamine-hydrolyzing) [Algoriphagus machipongonensis]